MTRTVYCARSPGGRLSDDPRSSETKDAEVPPTSAPEKGGPVSPGAASPADPLETFRQAARLAEDRIAEVVAATSTLKADNETFRDRLEGELSEKYEKRRERLLLSSVQTLEAMDRAIANGHGQDDLGAIAAEVVG